MTRSTRTWLTIGLSAFLLGWSGAGPYLAGAAETETPKDTATKPKPRVIGKDERATMLEILNAQSGSDKDFWILRNASDPEAVALADSIAGVFKDAGWTVHSDAVKGMVLKPGLVFLAAEVEPPASAQTALAALEASGLTLKSATGYREYYEEKKREDAKWAGIPMTSEQTFVVVVGPNPKD